MPYTIITDSAADLPEEIKIQFNLEVIPTPVVIEGKDYFDRQTIQPNEFYPILRNGTSISTYHINSYMFYQHFEPYAQKRESLIYICFSTGLAGTFNAANLAKEELLQKYPDFDLTIIDSKSATLGFGLLVYQALLMQKAGATKEEVIIATENCRGHVEHIFTVDTLTYLCKGGRISKSAMVIGDMLSIHPIIDMDENGSLRAFLKVRGRKRSIDKCIEFAIERAKQLSTGENCEDLCFGVCHGDALEEAMVVRDELMRRTKCNNILLSEIGCAIGTHTGPGVIGIVVMKKYIDAAY